MLFIHLDCFGVSCIDPVLSSIYSIIFYLPSLYHPTERNVFLLRKDPSCNTGRKQSWSPGQLSSKVCFVDACFLAHKRSMEYLKYLSVFDWGTECATAPVFIMLTSPPQMSDARYQLRLQHTAHLSEADDWYWSYWTQIKRTCCLAVFQYWEVQSIQLMTQSFVR